MSKITHKYEIEENYVINFGLSNSLLDKAIDAFLEGSPNIDDEDWEGGHEVLLDFEGDFNGIKIYNSEKTKPVMVFIFDKIGVTDEKMRSLNVKLVC